MPLKPKVADLPRIRSALKLYRVSSYITGVLLLLLVTEVVLKYPAFGIQLELELGGPHGFLAFVPTGTVTGFNLSTGILIAHGWFYVLYLFADFRLWSIMRWPFARFIAIALGGVVPFLSFIVEHFITRSAHRELTELERSAAPETSTGVIR